MKKILPVVLLLPTLFFCSKTDTKDAVVKIGKNVFTKSQYEVFDKINKMYPTDPGSYFPGLRSRITQLVETELIYNNIPSSFRDSLKKSADWQLKKKYYPAQIFLIDYLSKNLGFTEAEISSSYEAHKESFKTTITNDSTKTDSTFYRSLESVKNQIIDSLFLKKHSPDSAFLTRFDSLADTSYIYSQWLSHIRQTLPSFFMKTIYAEVNGRPYPDSISDIFGDDKYVTQNDLDVILSWIPEARRKLYSTPERQRELIEWLVRWKLFSSYAQNKQIIDKDLEKNALKMAWKLNVVYAYVDAIMVPKAKALSVLDTAMLRYAMYDDNGYTPFKNNDNGFENKLRKEERNQILGNIAKEIMTFRNKVSITMLQNDWVDVKNQKPDSLYSLAETYRDSGKTNEAKNTFLTLTKEFSYTEYGLNAFIELAKLQTEQQLYSQAISNYRKFLVNAGETDKRCNTFFMIGFIYDEYLDKPKHAEFNYKWVLKNTPDCELSDDAEFMMLHLNEPMSSVEELRDEATRQGRKIEDEPQEK